MTNAVSFQRHINVINNNGDRAGAGAGAFSIPSHHLLVGRCPPVSSIRPTIHPSISTKSNSIPFHSFSFRTTSSGWLAVTKKPRWPLEPTSRVLCTWTFILMMMTMTTTTMMWMSCSGPGQVRLASSESRGSRAAETAEMRKLNSYPFVNKYKFESSIFYSNNNQIVLNILKNFDKKRFKIIMKSNPSNPPLVKQRGLFLVAKLCACCGL